MRFAVFLPSAMRTSAFTWVALASALSMSWLPHILLSSYKRGPCVRSVSSHKQPDTSLKHWLQFRLC